MNEISVDGVLGIRTYGSRMVGTYKSTELWWHPKLLSGFIIDFVI